MINLDEADKRLLQLLQQDASLTNQELALRAHMSAATALRRVKRLREIGVIERTVALLAPLQALGFGAGLTAIVEVSLQTQTAEALAAFESHVTAHAAIQQCYRVSPGPDFVLVAYVQDMPAYHALAQALFSAQWGARTVRTFFSTHRAKFDPQVPL